MDARQGLIGGQFITPVFPLQLLLDLIIRYIGDQRMQYYSLDLFHSFFFYICTELQGGLPRDVVSHVALTVAAIGRELELKGNDQLDSSLADGSQSGYSLYAGYLVADKRAMLLENIALALSMVDRAKRFRLDPHVFQILFEIAYPLLEPIPRTSDQKIPYPGFGRSLLHLSRSLPPGHKETRLRIARCLSSCPVNDWIAPMAENVGDAFVQLLHLLLSQWDYPTHSLLNDQAEFSDDSTFLTIIKSPRWIHPFHRSIPYCMGPDMSPVPPTTFISKVLLLQDQDPSTPSVLLEIQIFFAAAMIEGKWLINDVFGFPNWMVAEDSELFWPPYFITAGIVPLTHAESSSLETRPVWWGEALLMLWRKGRRERAKGGLPSNWDDSIFFGRASVMIMLEYLKRLRVGNYADLNWNLIKEYFRKALDMIQDKSHHDGGHPYSFWGDHEKKVAQIVQDLCDYSNDHPPPPLVINPS